MNSTQPYLIRAIYDWIVDNQQTPHLLVEVTGDQIQVPRQYVEDGLIVLNVSPNAVRDLELGNDVIRFCARFGGVSQSVSVPVEAVQAVYARENRQGISLIELGTKVGRVGSSEHVDDVSTVAKERSRGEQSKRQHRGAPKLTIVD